MADIEREELEADRARFEEKLEREEKCREAEIDVKVHERPTASAPAVIHTPPCRLVTDDYRGYEALSQSDLKLCWRNPQLYYEYMTEMREKPGPTDAQQWGTNLERYIRTGGQLPKGVVVVPQAVLTSNGQKRGKKYQEWLSHQPHADVVWSPKEYLDHCNGFSDSLANVRQHKSAVAAIDGEWSTRWLWELRGETMKAELDVWHEQTRIIVDLKTTIDCSARSFARSVVDFGYDVQAAAYIECMRQQGYSDPHYYWLAVRNKPPFDCEMYYCSPDFQERGFELLHKYMVRFQECRDTGLWKNKSHDYCRSLKPPKWAMYTEEFDNDDA